MKTETKKANCCKISKYKDDNVEELDGWQSDHIGCKAARHKPMCSDRRYDYMKAIVARKCGTSGAQCVVQTTNGNTPMVQVQNASHRAQKMQ